MGDQETRTDPARYPGPRSATCIRCGKLVRDDREVYCNHCGERFWNPLDWEQPAEAQARPVVVWSYPGRTQADAAQLFAEHASELAAGGYAPVSQSWAEGRPGAGRVLALGLLANSIRPRGYLTVTYTLRESHAPEVPAESPDPIEQIRRLGELRDAGLISDMEYETKRTELLARI